LIRDIRAHFLFVSALLGDDAYFIHKLLDNGAVGNFLSNPYQDARQRVSGIQVRRTFKALQDLACEIFIEKYT